MVRSLRLVAAVVLLATAACAGDPTQPAAHATITAPAAVRPDSLSEPDPNGGCRSGYTLTNGRCVPI